MKKDSLKLLIEIADAWLSIIDEKEISFLQGINVNDFILRRCKLIHFLLVLKQFFEFLHQIFN